MGTCLFQAEKLSISSCQRGLSADNFSVSKTNPHSRGIEKRLSERRISSNSFLPREYVAAIWSNDAKYGHVGYCSIPAVLASISSEPCSRNLFMTWTASGASTRALDLQTATSLPGFIRFDNSTSQRLSVRSKAVKIISKALNVWFFFVYFLCFRKEVLCAWPDSVRTFVLCTISKTRGFSFKNLKSLRFEN